MLLLLRLLKVKWKIVKHFKFKKCLHFHAGPVLARKMMRLFATPVSAPLFIIPVLRSKGSTGFVINTPVRVCGSGTGIWYVEGKFDCLLLFLYRVIKS
jgi:hypothetical protein